MRVNLGTKVITSDGKDVGKIDRLVVDPRTDRMQEFVVRKGFFVEHDIIIPIGEVEDRIGNDDDDALHLRMTAEQVKRLPEFVEHSYMAAPDGMYPGMFGDSVGMAGATGGGFLWPAPIYMPAAQGSPGRAGLPADAPLADSSGSNAVAPGMMGDRLRESRPGNVFLSTGTDVKTRDGDKIGTVDELVVDPQRGKVTEMIVRKGLFGGKEVRIPTQFIDEIDDDTVYVALDKERLERFTVAH
ncbi:MAG: PRC-barrel domain-containing protein [Thermomicrobiales bacterium]